MGADARHAARACGNAMGADARHTTLIAANKVGARHRTRVVGCDLGPGSVLIERLIARVVIGDIDHVFDLIDLGADGLFDAG